MSSVLGQRLSWQDARRRDWTSSEGLAELTNIVAPLLPFAPHPFQIKDSACILKGLDVFCVSATGDGKSALIYIPALVCDGITLVIEPTNFLQSSLALSLQKRGIKILVINSETRHEAEGQRRNLWKEAAEGLYQVVALSPESLRTAEFDVLVKTKSFRLKWTNLAVDESHLTDEWGGDFRPLYEDIYSVRSRGPDHLCVIALSATVEPGPQTTRIMNHIGFRPKAHYLDRRDCERLNMAIIFRDVKFSFSGFIFRDIDWVIPVGIQSSTDIPKTLLRSLLPRPLRPAARTIIRHLHSATCPECKKEGLDILLCSRETAPTDTAIFVATAVLDVGVDPPDVARVIMFPTPRSASATVQRAGRILRAIPGRGHVYVYIKKTDREAALTYANTEPIDERLLTEKGPVAAEDVDMGVVENVGEADDHGESMEGSGQARTDNVTEESRNNGSTVTASTPTERRPITRREDSTKYSLLLIIAAHALGRCLVRQMNIIFGNPRVDHDCGRCSSCCPDTPPDPRPLPLLPPSPLPSAATPTAPAPKIARWEVLTSKERKTATMLVKNAAHKIRRSSPNADDLCITPECFFSEARATQVTKDFHLVISKDVLATRMPKWRYWAMCGDELWAAVGKIHQEMRSAVKERHKASKAKANTMQRAKREREAAERQATLDAQEASKWSQYVEENGLAGRRLKLHGPRPPGPDTPGTSAKAPPTSPPKRRPDDGGTIDISPRSHKHRRLSPSNTNFPIAVFSSHSPPTTPTRRRKENTPFSPSPRRPRKAA